MVKGVTGTEAEAMEMARGRVGRRNPLDDRKF
jgi:hypothetical protein